MGRINFLPLIMSEHFLYSKNDSGSPFPKTTYFYVPSQRNLSVTIDEHQMKLLGIFAVQKPLALLTGLFEPLQIDPIIGIAAATCCGAFLIPQFGHLNELL